MTTIIETYEANTRMMKQNSEMLQEILRQVKLVSTHLGIVDESEISGHREEVRVKHDELLISPESEFVELFKFDGKHPESWIAHAETFFKFHQTDDNLRISIAALHFEGIAHRWYLWMKQYRQLSCWENFTKAMIARFHCPTQDNPLITKVFDKMTTSTTMKIKDQIIRGSKGLKFQNVEEDTPKDDIDSKVHQVFDTLPTTIGTKVDKQPIESSGEFDLLQDDSSIHGCFEEMTPRLVTVLKSMVELQKPEEITKVMEMTTVGGHGAPPINFVSNSVSTVYLDKLLKKEFKINDAVKVNDPCMFRLLVMERMMKELVQVHCRIILLFLSSLVQTEMDFQLVDLAGGNSRNLIPFVSMDVSDTMLHVVNRLVFHYVLHQMEQSNLKNLIVVVKGKDTSCLIGGWISKIFAGLLVVFAVFPKDIRAVGAPRAISHHLIGLVPHRQFSLRISTDEEIEKDAQLQKHILYLVVHMKIQSNMMNTHVYAFRRCVRQEVLEQEVNFQSLKHNLVPYLVWSQLKSGDSLNGISPVKKMGNEKLSSLNNQVLIYQILDNVPISSFQELSSMDPNSFTQTLKTYKCCADIASSDNYCDLLNFIQAFMDIHRDVTDEAEAVKLSELLYGHHCKVIFIVSTLFALQQFSGMTMTMRLQATSVSSLVPSNNEVYLFVGGVQLFFLAFVVGVEPVLSLFLLEMLPNRIRANAMSVCSTMHCVIKLFIGRLFLWLLEHMRPLLMDTSFATCCLAIEILVTRNVMESKGRSLQESITYTKKGFITFMQAIYVSVEDLTDSADLITFTPLDVIIFIPRQLSELGNYPSWDSIYRMISPYIVDKEHGHTAWGVQKISSIPLFLDKTTDHLNLEDKVLLPGDGKCYESRPAEKKIAREASSGGESAATVGKDSSRTIREMGAKGVAGFRCTQGITT